MNHTKMYSYFYQAILCTFIYLAFALRSSATSVSVASESAFAANSSASAFDHLAIVPLVARTEVALTENSPSPNDMRRGMSNDLLPPHRTCLP